MSSEGYHEPLDRLTEEVMDRHRAISSLMEELEAVDWYDQRVTAASDDDLRAVLAHNRDEEKEHAAMVIEWLRRRDTHFDQQLRTYLFTEAPITLVETATEAGEAGDTGGTATPAPVGAVTGQLGIGSLKTDLSQEDPT